MSNANDETPSRQSSKLSLGSSSSLLSADEQLDGEGPLTPTDKIQDDEDDDLSLLQADSPGSLSNEEVLDEETGLEQENDDDDLETEQDSASPLSSIPDDFPLSRSASPEPSLTETTTKTTIKETVKKTVEETKKTVQTKTVLRKRRKEVKEKQKKQKQEKQEKGTHLEEASDQEQELATKRPKLETPENEANGSSSSSTSSSRRRRASRPETGTRFRRKSRQEEPPVTNAKKEQPDVEMTEVSIAIENEHEQEAANGTVEQTEEQASTDLRENEDRDQDQKHKEALEALTHIEIEFARLRDKMYQEKMDELNEEAVMIANGTHPELVTLMAEIEEKKGKRITSAEAWRRHQHANFKQQFEGFEYQANIHFISQKTALRRNLLSNLHSKKWNTEDERTKLNDPTQDPIYPNGHKLLVHKREQKEEAHELQDIIKRVGFPMAPDPSSLSTEDVDEDLKKLGINL
ncbi:hypothetical protein K501DRAFT_285531 [Backusella circina FSU 941]|nr:hypothetical protein K501DRAFT_285531 [Backusella circina FSU 941]